MDVRNWCNSGCKTVGYHEIGVDGKSAASATTTIDTVPNKLKRRGLWFKFKKEKRKMFESQLQQIPYDPYTYSQNFDQGFAWDEPDNLSRSFSMRFADPSSVFRRKAAV